MGRFDSTKAAIDANIKKNDNQEITGSILNYVMNNMVDATESQLEATDTRITEVSDAFAEASSEIEALATELESQNEMIADLNNMKIDKEADDYYPQLSVGLADNLAGEDVVDSEVSFRRSGGGAISDGVARIEAIKGNSLVWNQKVRNVLDTTGAEGWWNRGNTQLSLDGNKIIMATGASGFTMMSQKVGFIENHKYLIAFDVEVVTELEAINLVLLQSGDLNGNSQRAIAGFLQKDARFASFYTASADMPYIAIYHQIYLNEGDTTTFDGIKVIDLTLMFGVGNEPTTIDEFNARKPLGIDENAYNEGEVIHMDAQSLESVGVNQWDEEWELGRYNPSSGQPTAEVGIRNKNKIRIIGGQKYYCNYQGNAFALFYDSQDNLIQKVSYNGLNNYLSIANREFVAPINAANMIFYAVDITTYNHDICINLSDASVNGKYFPYIKRTQSLSIIGEGLKSAGTAHDEIRYNKATQKWEKVQRIGSVDMGSLNWSQYDVVGTFFTYSIKDYKNPTNNAERSDGLLCQHYVGSTNPFSASIDDKAWLRFESDNTIVFRDSAYTDAASFKAAMQGVMLYYELAEPIVTELDDDFNLDYEVWNGGTEKVISDVPTTPLKADIAYGFNAVGKIKELEEKLNNGGGGVSKDYVDGKLTELSAEVSGLSEKIDNLPSAESDVFKAEYGVTTYEEVKAAYDSGKVVHCDYNSYCYVLSRFTESGAYFNAVNGSNSYRMDLTTDDTWTSPHIIQIEEKANKVTTLSESSTDTQYPSAKAVYDALQNVGGGASSDKQGVIRQTQTWTRASDKGYDYVMSNLVRGAIPQANIDLFTSAGAIFNEESGYFELNGLTDISYEEMINIHNYTIPFSVGVIAPQGVMLGRRLPIRTPYALKAKRFFIFSSGNWDYLFWDSCIERVKLTEQIALNSLNTAFSLSPYLSDIDGVISLERTPNTSGIFTNCVSLRSIQLTKLKASIEIKQSPRLTNASILYMIENVIATSAIVITLHADAYARAMADAEILAALEAHPNVSLASA